MRFAIAVAGLVLLAACGTGTPVTAGPSSRANRPALIAALRQLPTTTTTTFPVPPASSTVPTPPSVVRAQPEATETPAAGSGDALAAIARWFPELYDKAVAVARCESTLNPGAVSKGGGNWGLFQINTVHRSSFEAVTGQPWSAVLNADANAQFARWLYDSSGWGPWSCRGAT